MGKIAVVCSGRLMPGSRQDSVIVALQRVLPNFSNDQLARFCGGKNFVLSTTPTMAAAESIVKALRSAGVDCVVAAGALNIEAEPSRTESVERLEGITLSQATEASSRQSLSNQLQDGMLWIAAIFIYSIALLGFIANVPGGLLIACAGALLTPSIRRRVRSKAKMQLDARTTTIGVVGALFIGLMVIGAAGQSDSESTQAPEAEAAAPKVP